MPPVWLVRDDPLVLSNPNSEAGLVKIPNVRGIDALVDDDVDEAVVPFLYTVNVMRERTIEV